MNLILNVILYCLLGLYAVSFITLLLLKKKLLVFNIVSLSLFLIYAVVRLILIPPEFDSYSSNSEIGIYLSTALISVLIILLCLFDKNKSNGSKSVAYAGLSIATAYALSFIKIEFLGGSITLASALPIIIYSYVFGTKKGIIAGVIFGILQFIQKATVYHPAQVILDYPVAFGIIGASGIVKQLKFKPVVKFIIGASIGLFGRFICHFLSGYFIFGIFAEYYGFNSAIWYSLVYNTYVFIDLAIVIFIGAFLFTNKSFINQIEKINE